MPENKREEKTKRYDKYIVAIGASAGGLEAIHEFFDHMPGSASFSFVVIQHLSSDYKSLLVELVAKHTHMKVFEAAHDMAIQQDCVYIIPNNKLMTVSNGRLKLAEKSLIKAPNTAIDHFLYTLARDKKEKAIAVILSGTGTDGTKGIQAIKERGGMVIVQDPDTAKFDGMPNSAILSGNADFVLPPSKMSAELFNYVNEAPIQILENGKVNETLLDSIFKLVHEQSGNNFHLYKTPTIIRRIGRRMNENKIKTLEEYVTVLKQNNEEVRILGQDFLIGVTKFFRDIDAFDVFSAQLDQIVEEKKSGDTLKIWVCACSTGQEAYTVAIIANECISRSGKDIDIKIFATDIDEKSIEIASRNQYPASIKQEVPSKLFKKYFHQDGKFFSLITKVRKQVVFAKHDVTKSPPFIKNDAVTCRNMLIYVNNVLQEKILSVFHFSLVNGGILFLGSSETASAMKSGLSEISGKWKIYKKTGTVNYAHYNTYNTTSATTSGREKKRGAVPESHLSSIEKNFVEFMVRDMGYAAVYIDKSYIIQEAIGEYRRYLSLPDGKIELNILKMLSREISVILNSALRKAWKEQQVAHLKHLHLKLDTQDIYLDVSVQPPSAASGSSLTLILFKECPPEQAQIREEGVETDHSLINHQDYIFELEAELDETRTNLQMAVEEMETTNEELQSANEELLSANEELQSSNEELQSLNEELHTLNTEHQVKIRELLDLNDDLDNYFRSTDIGQIFIDPDMYIRKFNVAAIAMVNLIEADIGRSIEQISNNIVNENLNTDIQQVLSTGHVTEKEVTLKNGKSSLMRIMPYIRKDRKTDGVVITFVDISKLTELNNIITGVFNASLNGVMVFRAIRNKQHLITDFEVISFNDAAVKLLKKNHSDLQKAHLTGQLEQLLNQVTLDRYINVTEKGTPFHSELQLRENMWIEIVAVKMADGFAATLTDITQKKISEQKLKRNYNELLMARENLKQLNSGLEVKVRERTRKLSESESRFNLVSRATNDTVWDWNLSENTMWRNDNFSTMFGYENNTESQNITFFFNKIHPDDKKRVVDSVYDAINQGAEQWSSQYRLKRKDGSYATILDRGSILLDENGVPYRMVGSILDISVLTDTEIKLNSTERKFRKIFDSNVIGMLFSDVQSGKIETANRIFLDMLGYTQADFQNGNINWKDITPEEYMPISKMSAELLRAEGFCPPFEKQYLSKSGKAIDVLVGAAVLDPEHPRDAVTYVIDISKQKHNEKRRNELQQLVKRQQEEFYRIFQKAPALISIRRGPELRYEFVNDAFISFDGDVEHIGAKMATDSPLYIPEIIEIEQQVLQTGETFIASAYPVQKQTGTANKQEDRWFDLILNPVFSADGKIDGISFFGFEVTDLMVAQRTTKALMNKKDEFMSIASHELKTPITSIKGYLQFAMKMAGEERFGDIFRFIDKANRQVGKLTTLVDDLLDVTKIQAGKMTFNTSTFKVEEVVNEAVDGVQGSLTKQTLVRDVDDIAITADRNRIEQVISNFLSNAVKYSPQDKEIKITAKSDGKMLKLSVKDEGIGIPPDKAKLIFERFFRVEDSSSFVSGLGLGLYISSQIIHRHGGEIGVESVPGNGSEFWFSVPLQAKL
ncbi:chemotaxis protein CheB [Pedobacter rhizosphaerae]|uniref:Two-component system, chemotaxis family, CheB/CheR fusion protein n=1 Tax=Pedobacter rhizosphaerae TaxID=390241 RepID=A0A1H9QN32_9SPHI|nr:chemotaxis protein CheB [Pedobacter rhizosphaerae]SER61872.1 two-component system, chemotaxis family, CheB/CheR fusion protein [Pedobacter rhizosphaerae]